MIMKQLIKRQNNHYNLNELINQKGDFQFFSMIYKKMKNQNNT